MKQHERFFKSTYAVSLSLILVLLSAISAFAEPEFYTGYVPPEEPWAISTPKRTRREVLPPRFDARTDSPQLSPNFKLPPIRNQHSTGTCWAHSTLACVESYLGGENNFSEGHMAYNINSKINLGTGGNANYACQYFSNLVGPITEKDYDGYDGELDNNFTQPGSSPRRFFKPGRYDFMGDVNNKRHESYVGDMIAISAKEEEIKKYVYNYGIVAASYYVASESGMNADDYYDGEQDSPDLKGYRYTATTQPNHMIAIIGWDDDKTIKNKFGSSKGAYLVRNSWGENWGNNGYFWMSYDTLKEQFWSTTQNKFFDNNAFVFTNIKEKKANIYTDYPQYPFMYRGFNTKSVTYASLYNRDRAKNEVVTDIAIYNPNPGNTTYKLYFSEKDTITDGTGIEKDDTLLKEDTFDHSGYYTLEIDEDKQPLLTQDKFTIKAVVTNTGGRACASTPTNKVSSNKTYSSLNGSSFTDFIDGGIFILYTKDAPNATYKADIQLKNKADADLTDDTETGGFKFTDKEEGYEAISAKELVIANTGTGDLLNTVVTLTGTNAENFTITKPSQSTITKDQSVTFTVKPKDGLTAGTYTAQIKITADHMTEITKEIKFTVTAKPVAKVTDIIIKTPPTKLTYTEDEALDLTGLKVTLTYEDTTTKDVSFEEFSANNITTDPSNGAKLVVTNNKVTITYNDGAVTKTVDQAIKVNAKPVAKVTGITIETPPTKVTYTEDEALDLTGLKVTLTYNDGQTKNVSFAEFSANNITTDPVNGAKLVVANNKVTITYKDGAVTKSVNQDITVKAKPVVPAEVNDITIKTPPTKVTYTEDETLDLTGLEVTLIYNDGQTKNVSFAEFSANNITTDPSNGAKLVVTNNKVTITYNDGAVTKTVDQAIKVNAKPVVPAEVNDITIKTPPIKVTYKEDETLDLTGLEVTLTYNDGQTKNVSFAEFSANNITTDPVNGAKLVVANNKVTITYKDGAVTKSVNQDITVKAKPVVPAEVNDITIKTPPTKLTYTEDETLDLTGLEVTLTYNDGQTKNVSFADFATNNITTDPANGAKLAVTNNKVTITYKDAMVTKTVDQAITVNKKPVVPAKVTEITVKTQPTKVTYTEDETLNLAGLEVTLKYDDGQTRDVSFADFATNNITTNPANGTKLAVTNNKVTITYKDAMVTKTVDQAITVNKKPVVPAKVTDITVKTQPNKVTYTEDETLNLAGLEVTLKYDDGTSKNVAFAEFGANNITTDPANGAKLAVTNDKVTITYNDGAVTKTVDQAITVNKKPVVPITTQNIEIQTPPNKVTYTEGETLDLTGLVIRLIKSNGSIEDIPFTDFKAKNITTYPENGDILTTADSSIMIIYKEGNVTQIIKQFITVNAKSSGGSGSGHARSHERKDRNEPKKEPAEEPKKEEPKKEQPVPVVPISLTFVDVNNSDWFNDAVSYVYTNGLMNGMDETTFEPNGNTTRAMVAQVLYNISGKPETSMNYSMKDVTSSDWYKNSVSWAIDNKIASGVSTDMFGANQPITREQMVTMLYNYAKYEGFDVSAQADLTAYSDSYMVSPYANKAFRWAIASNIISGMGNNDLSPQGFTTRAQLAVMLKAYKGL